MKWIAIAGIAGAGYLWYRGGASSDVIGSLSAGWTATLGDLHLGPCTGCAGSVNPKLPPKPTTGDGSPMMVKTIFLGH